MQIEKSFVALRIPFALPVAPDRSLERFVYAYLVHGERVLLVDTGVRGAAELFERALQAQGRSLSDVGAVVFTHAHPDHIGGAQTIVQRAACRTFAHPDAVDWIEDTVRQARERPVPGFDAIVEGPVSIDEKIEHGRRLDVDGAPALEVVATPGHARGHIALYAPAEGVLITGDAVPQLGAMPIYEDLAASVASLRALEPFASRAEWLLSSWDDPCPKRDIRERLAAGYAALQSVHDAVRAELACGEANEPLPLTARVVARLGLPPFAKNPLTASTIMAHARHADTARITDL
jgi:glyoxylase-like metal-dependent hydrolase (beta-lactamase superfamily II)